MSKRTYFVYNGYRCCHRYFYGYSPRYSTTAKAEATAIVAATATVTATASATATER